MNAGGGVFVKAFNKKIPLQLISYDDQSNTATAATLYNQLITQDNVDIQHIVGSAQCRPSRKSRGRKPPSG